MTDIAGRSWRSRLTSCAWIVCAMVLAVALRMTPVNAQGAPQQAAEPPPFTPQQLEQLVAPIALYPDDLLSQVLMASTYPIEVVQAARWANQNPNMTGKALEDAMVQQKWDSSIKGLVAVPQTLQMMSDKLDWTQQLGDAFLADQAAVLDAVQRLRQRAEGAGNLKTSPQQKVARVSQPGPSGQPVERIVVERVDPQVAYVPVYDPGVAFGAWPYPEYPPYYWYPSGWVPGTFAYGAMAFTAGAVVGAAIWGGANWWGGSVNINAARYNSFNRTNIAGGNWNHVAAHRGNVPYRNNATAQRFGGRSATQVGQGNRQGLGGAGNRQGAGNLGGAGQKGAGNLGGAGQKGAGNRQGAGQKGAGAGQKGAANRKASGGQKSAGNRAGNRAAGAARSGNAGRGHAGGVNRAAGGMHRAGMGGGGRAGAMRMGGGGGMRMGGGGGMRGGGMRGGGGRGGRRSDINVKHDILFLGHLDNGLGFYRFAYKGSDKAYVGVMAQEVQFVRPDAASRGQDGTLRVRYDMLGVRFQSYDQWLGSGARLPATVRTH